MLRIRQVRGRWPVPCAPPLLRAASLPTRKLHLTHLPRHVHHLPTTLGDRHRRHVSFFAILGKAVRVPAALGGVMVGGAAYVNHKVNEATGFASDKLNGMTDWAKGAVDGISGFGENTVNSMKDFMKEFNSARSESAAEGAEGGAEGGGGAGTGGEGSGGGSGGNPGPTDAAALAAAVGAATYDTAEEEVVAPRSNDEAIMLLTKKMIEIRAILSRVQESEALQLPSIVVIGSQSSGKSSVLEAIVGHEFLPKGSNMVTRRPIELTLINTPDSASEYGEFPALNMGKITDFNMIQRTLTELNLAVPEKECISDDPIQLHIYSPNVPDLNLTDLPGYIQVSSHDQPIALKTKIQKLCEKYIQPPNIILAISAADVDLANSSALRASRRVDPQGERTIGVITKMDLVDPIRGYNVLNNKEYPLSMGYVGVITRAPSGGLFRRSSRVGDLVSANEQAFFSQAPEYNQCEVGTNLLKEKLMYTLEKTLAKSLIPTFDAVQQELEEATYMFKVEYNDRSLTPSTYLASSLDSFKQAFKDFSKSFDRDEVKSLLRCELDQRVLDLLAQRYWNKPIVELQNMTVGDFAQEIPLSKLSTAPNDDPHWQRKLDASTSTLTKLGIGRLSTNLVINSLVSDMERLTSNTTFAGHPFAYQTIHDAASSLLNMRYYSTAEQVENCIKPFKYEIDMDDREWSHARDHAYVLLKEELRQCEQAFSSLKSTIGGRKLSQVITFVDKTREQRMNGNSVVTPAEGTEAYGFSAALLQKGREGLFLKDRAEVLKMRMAAIKSRQCKSKDNKYNCPEIFLNVVADKMTQTAVLFLNVELLNDFYHNFPRELDMRFGQNLTKDQIDKFAKEDPKIKRHIELQERKELLDEALHKIKDVIALQGARERGELGQVQQRTFRR